MGNRRIVAALVCSFLVGLSPLVAQPVIERGIDVFTTGADGDSYYDFASNPIPAGFFCHSSQPFRGRVTFKGLPLTTEIPGQLGGADTVVERLDDAVLNAKGRAMTRLQFRALSLVSIAPVKTACGAFYVYVSLAGQQRVTTMEIHRTWKGGGSFAAPLAVDARLTFVPVKPARGKRARKLELTRSFTFPATAIPWSFAEGTLTSLDEVSLDTDGDLVPDTQFSSTSNFLPGQSPRSQEKVYCCAQEFCHSSDGCLHCYVLYPRGCQGECP